MNKNTLQGKIHIPFGYSSSLLPDDSAGRITRELWWTNQEISSVNIIIQPQYSTLMYHLGDEQ
jgi:hypothetical protein